MFSRTSSTRKHLAQSCKVFSKTAFVWEILSIQWFYSQIVGNTWWVTDVQMFIFREINPLRMRRVSVWMCNSLFWKSDLVKTKRWCKSRLANKCEKKLNLICGQNICTKMSKYIRTLVHFSNSDLNTLKYVGYKVTKTTWVGSFSLVQEKKKTKIEKSVVKFPLYAPGKLLSVYTHTHAS